MRYLKYALLCSIVLLFSASCYRDPLEGYLTYRLEINNQTNKSYNIYQSSSDTAGDAFSRIGTLDANSSITISRLITDVVYTFRLVEGDVVDQPAFEQIIHSKGDNVNWNVGS